jgi:hypothetical protein
MAKLIAVNADLAFRRAQDDRNFPAVNPTSRLERTLSPFWFAR